MNIYAELNCTYYFYNFSKKVCFPEIPEGYYLENEILKTIAKCHSNCKTCNGKENVYYENCKTCPTGKFLYLKNCTDNCINGYFTDLNNSSINICKCNDIKCYYCSYKSMNFNLCESCNNEEGYYPKMNDSLNIYPFVNCYKYVEKY